MISSILFLIIGLKLNMGLAFYILVTIKASIELINILYKLGKGIERFKLRREIDKSFDKMIETLKKIKEKEEKEEKEKHPEEENTEAKQEGNNGEENI